jgi:hypothetical protein
MCIISRPVTPRGHHDGDADGAEGYRRGVGDKADPGGVHGLKTETNQHGCGDGHGGAEAGGAFDEGAEREGDEQGLQAAVIGDAGQGIFDDLKLPGFNRHVVHPDGRNDDEDDGEKAK